MKREKRGKAKFVCVGTKDEFVKKVQSQIGLFNAAHKADFISEIKDGNLSIGMGRTSHGGGLWYEPVIVEKENSIIIDGTINDVSWHDENTKWWQNLIMWIFIFIPLYIAFSPVILFRFIFSPLIGTPNKKLKKFMVEYMNCTEIKKNAKDNLQTIMAESKKTIQSKDQLKQKYKQAFGIVKKYIDELDPMGLLELSAPPDEYECEVAEILTIALKTTKIDELANWIIKVFDNTFNEHNLIKKPQVIETATKMLDDLNKIKDRFDYTCILTREQLNGTCYYEFYLGKFKNDSKHFSENSIYFDENGISIFSIFISNFAPLGITILSKKDIKDFVDKLKNLHKLLADGKSVIEALQEMDFYKLINSNGFEKFIANAEIVIIKNTANALADWLTENLEYYEEISILGI